MIDRTYVRIPLLATVGRKVRSHHITGRLYFKEYTADGIVTASGICDAEDLPPDVYVNAMMAKDNVYPQSSYVDWPL